MSESCKFTKAGLMAIEWNNATDEWEMAPEHIFSLLSTECEIEEGVTLSDIFHAVEKYEELMLFMASYAWCWDVRQFHEQIKKPGNNEEKAGTYLEVYRAASIHSFEGKDNLTSGCGFHLIDPNPAVEYKQISVSCTPLNEIANLPVRLNTNYEIYKKSKESVLPISVLKTEMSYTLLEVLHAIYWEVSFYGGPEAKEDFVDNMKGIVKGIENGTVETFPMDMSDFFIDGVRE